MVMEWKTERLMRTAIRITKTSVKWPQTLPLQTLKNRWICTSRGCVHMEGADSIFFVLEWRKRHLGVDQTRLKRANSKHFLAMPRGTFKGQMTSIRKG